MWEIIVERERENKLNQEKTVVLTESIKDSGNPRKKYGEVEKACGLGSHRPGVNRNQSFIFGSVTKKCVKSDFFESYFLHLWNGVVSELWFIKLFPCTRLCGKSLHSHFS